MTPAETVWIREACIALRQAAEELPTLTSDDVMDRLNPALPMGEKRNLGWVMRNGASMRLIRKEDCAPIPSRRKSLHASPRAVWRSLIYKGDDE